MPGKPLQPHGPSLLTVSEEEGGMKLLRFLERRLESPVPGSVLHKWIRSGQVRVNGGRAAPFRALAPGDAVRLPPFAQARHLQALQPKSDRDRAGQSAHEELPGQRPAEQAPALGSDLELHAATAHYLVLAKPAGLACQGGSGQSDSLAGRLERRFAGYPFIPAPAHRLDKATSGLVLAGLSHAAQRRLHELLQRGGLIKDYLAWSWGPAAFSGLCLLEDRLERPQRGKVRQRTIVLPGGRVRAVGGGVSCAGAEAAALAACPPELCPPEPFSDDERGQRALCLAVPLQTLGREALPPPLRGMARQGHDRAAATLLLLRLLTGRRHQLRAQLASRGLPVIGDSLYGGPDFACMLLHAHALVLPEDLFAEKSPPGPEYILPPPWPRAFLPQASLVQAARRALSALPARPSLSGPAA